MAEKTKAKNPERPTAPEEPLKDMAEAARRNYEQAVRTGQRLQEEAGQWWSRAFGQVSTMAEWQKQFAQFSNLATRAMPVAQKRFDEALTLLEKNTQAGAELMKKALEAAQTLSLTEAQVKWMEVWTASMKAMQHNVEAVAALSTRGLDTWVDFMRKSGQAPEARTMAVG